MFFVIKDNLPYIVGNDKIYPCEVSATQVRTDKNHPMPMPKDAVLYTYSEILGKFGICLVDGWNATQQKVVKVSNKVVSSIPKSLNTPANPDALPEA